MPEETHTTQAQQQAELQKRLWAIANDLRGTMDASEYRNYILGLIFYRFLSDQIIEHADKMLAPDHMTFEEAYAKPEYQKALEDELISQIGFFIEPKYLFPSLVKDIQEKKFDIEELQNAINEVQNSTLGQESEDDFRGLFEDMVLDSPRLGNSVPKRGDLISKVILSLANISFKESDLKIDVLGDAYEYLIGQFAAGAGKKAGEFYTPQQVSKLLAQIVTMNRPELKRVYDPTMGSGSLLLQLGNYAKVGEYYGQEISSTTYNLARMNLLMHGVNYSRFKLYQGDTLEQDRVGSMTFDAVVANPPYSANWDPIGKLDDERFRKYGKTAPKSKADFAFVEHMLYHLSTTGIMAVVLPHGVLFRGAAEGAIRRYIIERDNVLDTVIGLPANLFYGTSIPTCVLVFKKNRDRNDVLFIDASNDFEKGKNQNTLPDVDVQKILDAYKNREDVDKYAHVASLDEIKENDYNLNIPRYVDTFEPEPPIDIDEVKQQLAEVDQQIKDAQAEFDKLASQLVWTDKGEHDDK
ncbi:type I restriction-modification system subunit M [Schleiferilactobacillus harbinensis]|uniref:site-specific DNA-methyltransferase (adenine-specific) n=1 Tax=Schleiferilactobacillus harbinensis TaxID=304207 RepID=A0ABU7T139_9LACO